MSLKYRPLALIGFTVLAVLFLSIFIDERLSLVSVAGGTLIFISCVVFKKIRDKVFPFFIAGALILGGMLFTVENDYGLKFAQSLVKDSEVVIDGTLADYPTYSDSRYYYIINTESVDGKAVNVKLRLSVPEALDAEPYDKITAKTNIYLIGNSAGEDVERYFQSKGIYLGAYDYNNEESGTIIIRQAEKRPIFYYILLLRNTIEARILDKLPNEYGGTAVALLLGDKSYISEQTKDGLYEAGIAPVFAVSGLHLSIWVMGLYEILEQLRLNKKTNSIINIAFTLFFMALTGFSPSVCRSGLMMILLLSGNLFYRRSDSINSLGFATLILCIINPLIAADIGFLMSFSATFGIVTICPLLEKNVLSKIRVGVIKTIASAVFVSVAAIIGSLPVSVLFIEYISLFSILTNLLVTYVAAVCMIFSGFTAILFRIDFLSDMTAFCAGQTARYILGVVGIVNRFSVTSVSTADIFWKSGAVICLVILIFTFLFLKGRTAVKFCSVALSTVIIVTSVCSVFYYDGLTRVEVLDVGDGICVVATVDNRKILLCGETDGYGAVYTVEYELDSISRRNTNLILIPNINSAECSSTLQLLKNNDFVKVLMPYCPQSAYRLIEKESLITATDSTLNVWENGSIVFHFDNETSYAYCTFDLITFFIIFSSKIKTEFPDDFRSADYLITSGYIPDSLDPSSYGSVILSTVNKKACYISEYVNGCGGRALSTCEVGGVSVRIRNSEDKIYLQSK